MKKKNSPGSGPCCGCPVNERPLNPHLTDGETRTYSTVTIRREVVQETIFTRIQHRDGEIESTTVLDVSASLTNREVVESEISVGPSDYIDTVKGVGFFREVGEENVTVTNQDVVEVRILSGTIESGTYREQIETRETREEQGVRFIERRMAVRFDVSDFFDLDEETVTGYLGATGGFNFRGLAVHNSGSQEFPESVSEFVDQIAGDGLPVLAIGTVRRILNPILPDENQSHIVLLLTDPEDSADVNQSSRIATGFRLSLDASDSRINRAFADLFRPYRWQRDFVAPRKNVLETKFPVNNRDRSIKLSELLDGGRFWSADGDTFRIELFSPESPEGDDDSPDDDVVLHQEWRLSGSGRYRQFESTGDWGTALHREIDLFDIFNIEKDFSVNPASFPDESTLDLSNDRLSSLDPFVFSPGQFFIRSKLPEVIELRRNFVSIGFGGRKGAVRYSDEPDARSETGDRVRLFPVEFESAIPLKYDKEEYPNLHLRMIKTSSASFGSYNDTGLRDEERGSNPTCPSTSCEIISPHINLEWQASMMFGGQSYSGWTGILHRDGCSSLLVLNQPLSANANIARATGTYGQWRRERKYTGEPIELCHPSLIRPGLIARPPLGDQDRLDVPSDGGRVDETSRAGFITETLSFSRTVECRIVPTQIVDGVRTEVSIEEFEANPGAYGRSSINVTEAVVISRTNDPDAITSIHTPFERGVEVGQINEEIFSPIISIEVDPDISLEVSLQSPFPGPVLDELPQQPVTSTAIRRDLELGFFLRLNGETVPVYLNLDSEFRVAFDIQTEEPVYSELPGESFINTVSDILKEGEAFHFQVAPEEGEGEEPAEEEFYRITPEGLQGPDPESSFSDHEYTASIQCRLGITYPRNASGFHDPNFLHPDSEGIPRFVVNSALRRDLEEVLSITELEPSPSTSLLPETFPDLLSIRTEQVRQVNYDPDVGIFFIEPPISVDPTDEIAPVAYRSCEVVSHSVSGTRLTGRSGNGLTLPVGEECVFFGQTQTTSDSLTVADAYVDIELSHVDEITGSHSVTVSDIPIEVVSARLDLLFQVRTRAKNIDEIGELVFRVDDASNRPDPTQIFRGIELVEIPFDTISDGLRIDTVINRGDTSGSTPGEGTYQRGITTRLLEIVDSYDYEDFELVIKPKHGELNVDQP